MRLLCKWPTLQNSSQELLFFRTRMCTRKGYIYTKDELEFVSGVDRPNTARWKLAPFLLMFSWNEKQAGDNTQGRAGTKDQHSSVWAMIVTGWSHTLSHTHTHRGCRVCDFPLLLESSECVCGPEKICQNKLVQVSSVIGRDRCDLISKFFCVWVGVLLIKSVSFGGRNKANHMTVYEQPEG